ncbi:putative molybdenum transport system permease protein YvgM [Paenibacillus tyrfis]|uniref:molybdate ABC transporter permease subunit n=1 Tax=Paenibacillus tyrfis TaxID=1501230 RepID=UPI0024935E14|nr:molybdate ABC transporter permease subunit [Paenibacillus tyrfis]GLI04127.1 putative molybdenum transport system permease protein YvgM [Paenibacillus tyrfis]
MPGIDWNAFLSPVLLSVKVSLVASALVFVLGIVAAWGLSRRTFRGKTLLETALMLPLMLPPTVIGFILLVLLGKKSWFGRWIEEWFAAPLIFTWWAAVIAAVVVAFPLVYQTMKVGFASVDRSLEDAARSAGAGEWQVLRYITLPLAWRSLATAYILGFARALGEFGATLMIAGNIPGKTQTVPTAIYMAVESGRMTLAWWWTGSIIVISFMMMLIVNKKK